MSSEPSYAAVLVTYRRPELLARSIAALLEQTEPPATVVVVDNDADTGVRDLVAGSSTSTTAVHYVVAPSNGGPAGGLQLGLAHLDELDPDRRNPQAVFLDDGDPLPRPEVMARLRRLRAGLDSRAEPIAGVGMVGARWDDRHARLHRPGDDELHGAVPVDYIGGGQAPLYDRGAVARVGGVEPSLFFGFDDLHLGLRLQQAGYLLFADGDLWRDLRREHGRVGLPATLRRTDPGPAWRTYYSSRNLILILREVRSARQAARVSVRSLAGALRRREHLGMTVRGIADGWLDRRGTRVRPP